MRLQRIERPARALALRRTNVQKDTSGSGSGLVFPTPSPAPARSARRRRKRSRRSRALRSPRSDRANTAPSTTCDRPRFGRAGEVMRLIVASSSVRKQMTWRKFERERSQDRGRHRRGRRTRLSDLHRPDEATAVDAREPLTPRGDGIDVGRVWEIYMPNSRGPKHRRIALGPRDELGRRLPRARRRARTRGKRGITVTSSGRLDQ